MYGVFLFVGMASQVESTERGDRVIADQIRRYADMALDLDAPHAAGWRDDSAPRASALSRQSDQRS